MKYALLTTVSVAAFLAASPETALAQNEDRAAQSQTGETASNSNDIIVTARRREERLQDVPLSITALGTEQLNAQGVRNILDLGSGRVPGFSINSLFGTETAAAINIRGFGPNDASQATAELPVALYIDGVPLARAQGVALDLVTPERVEILRGPQGQLFGRNSEAGAVQIITRRPSGVLGGQFTTGIGNFGSVTTKGRLDLPEFGGFKVQLSGNFRRHGGYYNTPSNPALQGVNLWANNPQASFHFKTGNYDRDLNQLKTYGARAAVAFDSGPFDAYYSFDYSEARDDQGPTFFRNSPKAGTIFNRAGGTGPVSVFTRAGPGGSLLVFTEDPLGKHVPSDFAYSVPWVPFETRAYGHMLNLTYDASDDLTIRSITGSRYVRRQGGNTLTGAVNSVLPSAFEYMRSRTLSEELQAIYELPRFNLTAGGIYFKEKVVQEGEAGFAVNCLGAPGFPCTVNGQPSRPIYNLSLGSAAFKRSFSQTDVYGLYAQATYTPQILEDRIDLTAGIRYSNDKKRGRRPIDFGLNPTTGVVNLTNLFKTDRFDPAFSVKYKISDDANIYARYAVGYRDGGSSVRSPTFTSFTEDEMTTWEVGFKSDLFDRRLHLNLAGFYNRIKDEQVNLQSDPSRTPSLTDTFNSPVVKKIKGFEIEATARLFEGFSVSGNYTYLHVNQPAIGLDKVVVGIPLRSFVVNGTWSDATGLIPDAATLAAHPNSVMILLGPQGTPKHAGSVAVDYEIKTGSGRLAFHADWVKSTKQFVGAPAIYQTIVIGGVATPAQRYNSGITTNRYNANLSFRDIALAGTTAEIRLWMKNIFNHADGAFAFPAGNGISAATPHPNSIIYVQPPRTFGADLTVNF